MICTFYSSGHCCNKASNILKKKKLIAFCDYLSLTNPPLSSSNHCSILRFPVSSHTLRSTQQAKTPVDFVFGSTSIEDLHHPETPPQRSHLRNSKSNPALDSQNTPLGAQIRRESEGRRCAKRERSRAWEFKESPSWPRATDRCPLSRRPVPAAFERACTPREKRPGGRETGRAGNFPRFAWKIHFQAADSGLYDCENFGPAGARALMPRPRPLTFVFSLCN